MGVIEEINKRRNKRGDLKRLILETIHVAGMIDDLIMARTTIRSMQRMDLLVSYRQKDVIDRTRERLIRNGYLKRERGYLHLTPKGESALSVSLAADKDNKKPVKWDHKWRIIIFDIPEYQASLRQKVRDTLSSIGFVRLQNSVWAYPYDCEDLIILLKADLNVGRELLYMVVNVLEGENELKRRFKLS